MPLNLTLIALLLTGPVSQSCDDACVYRPAPVQLAGLALAKGVAK